MGKVKQNGKPQKVKNLKKFGITSKNEDRMLNDTVIKKKKNKHAKNKNFENLKASPTLKEEKIITNSLKNSPNNQNAKEKNTMMAKSSPVASGNKLSPLQMKMKEQLESSRFRWINEQLYTSTSTEALQLMKESPENYEFYHKGYRSQVDKWPENPVDLIISWLTKQKDALTVVDLGCGDAKIAQTVKKHKVHSFDLVAANDHVQVADSANIPLDDGVADVVVFCLSLMGTNLNDFLAEAHRLLKPGGILYIAEVKSRFEKIDNFILQVSNVGFKLNSKNLENTMFALMIFKKTSATSRVSPELHLKPCLYKKR